VAFLENQITFALLGGILPTLIWLWFWLREDIHPEPKRLIVKGFFAGVIAIPFALLFEAVIFCGSSLLLLEGTAPAWCSLATPLLGTHPQLFEWVIIIGFAFAEEYVKYKVAYKFLLRGGDFDEPVDAMIYLMTVALGFAAFENFFFLCERVVDAEHTAAYSLLACSLWISEEK